jgi:flagellar basal body-associated protein FliL
VTEEV